MSNIITQVSQDSGAPIATPSDDDFNSVIHLNVRGQVFEVTRDELMSLPESILLCLFPNGVFLDENAQVITNLTENDVVYVDFSPQCFNYIITTFSEAANSITNKQGSNNDYNYFDEDDGFNYRPLDSQILKTKPSVIVLREDLDFYCLPPMRGLDSNQMKQIKSAVANELLNHRQIFEGLGYAPGKHLGPAEQHLLDMLCNAGYHTTDDWNHRDVEPNKSVVSSLALVQLKSSEVDNESNSKLLLFWKKPARKCWWSSEVVEIPSSVIPMHHKSSHLNVKIHIRRVWTLELAVLH